MNHMRIIFCQKNKPSEELDNNTSVKNKAISVELVPSNHGFVKNWMRIQFFFMVVMLKKNNTLVKIFF